jgi:hypothetical protein
MVGRSISRQRRRRTFVVAAAVALTLSSVVLAQQAPRASASLVGRQTYELVGADGGVFAYGGSTFSGSLGGGPVRHKIVAVLNALANDAFGRGYLLVDSAGIVYPFGLKSLGDLRGVHLRAPIVAAIAAPGPGFPNEGGYLLVAADGGVFAFGTARFPGSLAAHHLPAPIVGIEPAVSFLPDSKLGYRLVDAAGHVFTLGGAVSLGDLGNTHLTSPVVGIISSQSEGARQDGYLLATADGKVFAFGSGDWQGDASQYHLQAPIAGIVRSFGLGYYLFASDGGIFSFNAEFLGSMGGQALNAPISAMGSHEVQVDTCAARARTTQHIQALTPTTICPL